MAKTYPDCHATTREAEPRHDCLDVTRHSTIRCDILHLASTALPNLVLTKLAITNLNKP